MEKQQYTRDDMAGLLREHGINPTHQRIEIAYALFSRQEHLSADQIMAVVNDRHSEVSKATVYNTLNLFKQHKLVREVIVDPSKVFYDPNTGPHHHFYNLHFARVNIDQLAALQIIKMVVWAGIGIVEHLARINDHFAHQFVLLK